MANTPYENIVLSNKITSILNTKLNTKPLMTIDSDLTVSAGMTKTINVYTYTGTVEELAEGAGNTVTGTADYVDTDYTVKTSQQKASYTDEKIMKDPTFIDTIIKGMADKMVNKINADYFAELAKVTLGVTYAKDGAISYNTVVDAVAKMEFEDESGLFLIINSGMLADLRKDTLFVSAKLGEILFKGQIATICGMPVILSNLCPAGVSYVAHKDAVTLFIKKDVTVADERDEDTRTNFAFARMVNLIALTDATKVVKITEALA